MLLPNCLPWTVDARRSSFPRGSLRAGVESPTSSPPTVPIVALVGAADSNMPVNWMDSFFTSKIFRSLLRKKLKSQVEKTRPPAEGFHHHLQHMVEDIIKNNQGGSAVKNLPANAGDRKWVQSLSPLEKIPWRRKRQPTLQYLAWEILWTEELGWLQSMGS